MDLFSVSVPAGMSINTTKHKLLLKTQVKKGQATSHSALAAVHLLLSSHLQLFTNDAHVLRPSRFFWVLFGFFFLFCLFVVLLFWLGFFLMSPSFPQGICG